jgi:hypothetical protein
MWLVLVLTLVAVPGTWLLLHRLSSPTTPRFTASDLPTPPPDAENGWVLVHAKPGGFAEIEDGALEELFVVDLQTDERVQRYDAGRAAIQRVARERERDIDEVIAALSRGRYADACPLDPNVDCRPLELLPVGELAMLRAWDMATRGDFAGAFGIARLVLARHADLARSARTLLIAATGALLLRRALGLIEALVVLADRADVPDEAWAESREVIATVLLQVRDDGVDPAQAVVADYVSARALLDSVLARGNQSPWLVDRRATTAWLDDRYEELHAYARGEVTAAPADEDPTGSPLYFLYNPRGKELLAAFGATAGPIERLVAWREDVRSRSAALHAVLTDARGH